MLLWKGFALTFNNLKYKVIKMKASFAGRLFLFSPLKFDQSNRAAKDLGKFAFTSCFSPSETY